VVLHLELDAGALARHQHATKNPALHPDLAALTDNKGLGRWPRVKVQVAFSYLSGILVGRAPLQNVDWALVSNKPVLVLPGDAHRGADLISDSGEAVSKVDRRRGGWWETETEEKGGETAPSTMVMRG
jgi:hypothetical protein